MFPPLFFNAILKKEMKVSWISNPQLSQPLRYKSLKCQNPLQQ